MVVQDTSTSLRVFWTSYSFAAAIKDELQEFFKIMPELLVSRMDLVYRHAAVRPAVEWGWGIKLRVNQVNVQGSDVLPRLKNRC